MKYLQFATTLDTLTPDKSIKQYAYIQKSGLTYGQTEAQQGGYCELILLESILLSIYMHMY